MYRVYVFKLKCNLIQIEFACQDSISCRAELSDEHKRIPDSKSL